MVRNTFRCSGLVLLGLKDALDSSRMAFSHVVGSAEGAGFNSHGREAVVCEPQDEIEARRAVICSLQINAAPAALNYSCFGSSTASRPWLFNDGPLDLVSPFAAGSIRPR